MRFALILLMLLFAVAGAIFGALNSQGITFDFYFGTLDLPKGGALLFALLLGWLLGGLLVYLSLVVRLRRRIGRMGRQLKQHEKQRADSAPITASADASRK